MSGPHELLFDDPESLAHELALSVAANLGAAAAVNGSASLVVSGGSTPRPFFAALAQLELPWESVTVTLADERWVDLDDEASNEGFVRRHLLVERAQRARFVGLKNGAATPEEGQDACEAALAGVPRPFDVVVLGMGSDGHTASLFPGAAELEAGLDAGSERSCLAVRPPDAPHPRMSLTLAALVASRRLVVHITGEAKRAVFRQAREQAGRYPIGAVLASGHPALQLYWAP